MKLTSRLFGAIAAIATLGSTPGAAEDFPTKAIRVICSVPAGGGVDVTARVLAEQLHRLWKQPVIVENRTGAGGNIGAEAVSSSPADGYTLLATPPAPLTVNATLYSNLNYDPTQLKPVAIMAFSPNVLAVSSKLPVKSVKELIEHAKANTTTFASQGNGSTAHLTGALFQQRTKLNLTHVPYRGTAPALKDLAGGHVDMMFVDLGSVLPLHESGAVRIIAVATRDRVPEIKDIPPVADVVPDFHSSTWYALAAPPKTPDDVVAKLNNELTAIMAKPEVKERYSKLYIRGSAQDVETVKSFIASETELWSGVVKAAGIKL